MNTNKNMVLRKIHDSFFLIDITQNYLNDKCTLYEVNEVGAFIWQQLESGCEASEVFSNIMSSIILEDGSSNDVLSDLNEYLNVLQASGFLED